MAPSVLEKDRDLLFPHFTVLKASAGSGKTYALTERFVQFILSDRIPRNGLRNILAITFSNNAAKEMRERVLLWLKAVYFDDPHKGAELGEIVTLEKEEMEAKAGRLIDEILDNYTDFQVRTIDSFMTSIFKTSALDFGYNPEFDILMSSDSLMEYAFDFFLRNVREGTDEARLFNDIISIILEHKRRDAAYLWDPSRALLEEIKKIYGKIASRGGKPGVEDFSLPRENLKQSIGEIIDEIEQRIAQSGLERNNGSSYKTIRSLVREGRFPDLLGKGLKRNPVIKPKRTDRQAQDSYDQIGDRWERLGELIREYALCYAHSCYAPYVRAYDAFSETVERIKRHQGKVFIEDVNRNLAEYLNADMVPDVYFRIGDSIYHFLIDEFQDTSPLQWRNLFPLLENSLSSGGSLFVVGDTKQAIYGFRDADYRIMKDVESHNPFPSARHAVSELTVNYRSLQRVMEFNERVFKEIVAADDTHREAARRSGLTNYEQRVREGREAGGYVEVVVLDRNDEDPPERQKIQAVIEELSARGFRYGEIALLTRRNEDVVKATSWLNEKNIPFISYSSLDIRRRKATGEIVSLLTFLDSPPDDLSFAAFILGDIFARVLERDGRGLDRGRLQEFLFRNRENPPLYKAFERDFGDLWVRYFEGLFKVSGYFPLYDLVTDLFSVFSIFETFAEEEATLVKILEVIKDFEREGYNSLRDFLSFAVDGEGGEPAWTIDVPKGVDAVKVMTIHKAKGLGFPAVIVVLYDEHARGFDYIAHEDGGRVRLLRITRDISRCHPILEAIYEEEVTRERVNRLNSLYVGFTRAEEELYVIGAKAAGGDPFSLLPVGEYEPSTKPLRSAAAPVEGLTRFPTGYHVKRLEFPPGPERLIALEERRRGDFIHRVLFFLDYVKEGFEEELQGIIQRVKEEMRVDYPPKEIKMAVTALLTDEGISSYFEERVGREIRKEQEFVDREGRLFRMDRVIIDEDRITAVDYKTGKDREGEEDYVAQMKNYLKLISETYPGKDAEGIIIYADLRQIRRVV